MVKWLDSYLSNRTQVVQIGTEVSGEIGIEFGTPQGSSISCLIFIVHTNDCEDWLTKGTLQTYADDSFQTEAAESLEDLRNILEEQGNKVLEFFASNNLVAKAEKSDLLIFRPSRGRLAEEVFEIRVGGVKIRESPGAKILGVYVSLDLKWKYHREELRRDLSFRVWKAK